MTTSSATPCGRPPARPASHRSGRFLRCGDGALPVNRPDEPLGLADFSVNARPSFMFRGAVGQIASLGISLMTKPAGRRPDTPLLDTHTPVQKWRDTVIGKAMRMERVRR